MLNVITYSSVVIRETICIAFTIAMLNDQEVEAAYV